jgi:transposase
MIEFCKPHEPHTLSHLDSSSLFVITPFPKLLEMAERNPFDLAAYCHEIEVKLADLLQKQAVNSQNSSKPPSQDGYAKPRPKSLRIISGKKPGGQPGHTGYTLKPVEKPDFTEIHLVSICPCGCGSDLSKEPVLAFESRQVFDLPPQKLIVTEHKVEVKRCPVSGKLVHTPWPTGVTAPVQYGPNYLAWLTYLNTQQFIPLARIDQMSFDLFGQHVSEDTVINSTRDIGQALHPFSVAMKALLLLAPVLHADETGLRVLKKLYWLHILSTQTLTWYGVHEKRGREAVDHFGILPKFKNRLVHDCWQTYLDLACLHALCNAHILRELTFIHEVCGQAWAKKLIDLLVDMNKKREEQKKVASCFPEVQLLEWHQQYQDIVHEGREANPPIIPPPDAPKKRGRKKQTKAQNLIERLEKYEECVLAFLEDFQIPFTNNQGEQDARMQKVKQKVSGCFRTFEGAELFALIRSYISTVRKQGRSVFQELKAALHGNPFIPAVNLSG